jgi:DNA-binding XRE family transcriptional regulator
MGIQGLDKQREKYKDWRWTQAETAKALGVDRTTIHAWQNEGLPCERRGREVLFKPPIAFSWTVGRTIAKEKKLDIEDALYFILLARCNGAPLAVMRQECAWVAEAIDRDRDDALVALGELMGRGLIS